MGVKVTFGFEEMAKVKSFPKLMTTNDGLIVYFMKESYGTVIEGELGAGWNPGEHSNNWDMENFKDHNGEINLRNE